MRAHSPAAVQVKAAGGVRTLDRLLEFHGPRSRAVVWAHNTHVGDARYTDVLEWQLYNAVLPGVSLDGQSYFYQNPLGRFFLEDIPHGLVVLLRNFVDRPHNTTRFVVLSRDFEQALDELAALFLAPRLERAGQERAVRDRLHVVEPEAAGVPGLEGVRVEAR